MPPGVTNKKAHQFWQQGFGESADGVVRFVRAATREKVMAQARKRGFRVVPVDDESGFGYKPVDPWRPKG